MSIQKSKAKIVKYPKSPDDSPNLKKIMSIQKSKAKIVKYP